MEVYEKIYLEAHINDRYIWPKNNTLQLNLYQGELIYV